LASTAARASERLVGLSSARTNIHPQTRNRSAGNAIVGFIEDSLRAARDGAIVCNGDFKGNAASVESPMKGKSKTRHAKPAYEAAGGPIGRTDARFSDGDVGRLPPADAGWRAESRGYEKRETRTVLRSGAG